MPGITPFGVRVSQSQGVLPVDPASLSWEVLLDSRNITPVANGAPVVAWPDSSGNVRDAAPAVPGPVYRPTGSALSSANLLPLVDFGAVANSQMFGGLPGAGLNPVLGFSLYSYYVLDSVPPGPGAADSQLVFADDIANGFRLFSSLVQGAGDVRPALQVAASLISPAAVQVGVGPHTLTCICHPPSGGTGTAELFYDGTLTASALWSMQPATTYLVSGNAAQNIWLRGRLGLVGIGRRNDSPRTRQGVERYLRQHWG